MFRRPSYWGFDAGLNKGPDYLEAEAVYQISTLVNIAGKKGTWILHEGSSRAQIVLI